MNPPEPFEVLLDMVELLIEIETLPPKLYIAIIPPAFQNPPSPQAVLFVIVELFTVRLLDALIHI